MKTYAVLGYTQSGKSTVGNMIAKATGGDSASISDYLSVHLGDVWGRHGYEIQNLKSHPVAGPYIRQQLYELGRLAEDQDPLSIINQMLADDVSIICGMRTIVELQATIEAKLFDQYWWVSRSGNVARVTDKVHYLSLDVRLFNTPSEIMFMFIDNSGTLEDLEYKVLDALGKESK
ncbi:hypothetical protein LCGC14_0298090 [marine sediment metagenome]|uniref:Uncharacterized protein n=1 Tax=marine sediment metagenome TaxID=412755 RepID=A0A0F9TR81_9ZZZZ